jgi:hypothetical protein
MSEAMERQLSTLAFAAVAASFASTALAGPLPGFTLRAETPRFAFYSRGDAKVNVAAPEKQLARVESLLGQKISGPVEYFQYDRAEDIAAATGRYAGGVFYNQLRQIHTTSAANHHELVHVVAFELGDPGPFFQEGLAVVLGDGGRYRGAPVDRVAKPAAKAKPLAALIASFDAKDPGEGYAVAGSFVSFLIKRHGLDKVTHFFRACSGGRGTAAAFEAIFGQTLENTGADWARSL